MSAGRTVNSQGQSWGTPPKYVNVIRRFFNGIIQLDPCSNAFSIVNADTEWTLPLIDGLKEDWNFPTIFVNPPYGADRTRGTTIKNWLAKCAFSSQKYKSEILALVPVATNTGHWKQSVFGSATGICFLYDTRLKFLENGKDVGKGAPMACAMVYWGDDYKRFSELFLEFGAVVDIRPLKKQKIGEERRKIQLNFENKTQITAESELHAN